MRKWIFMAAVLAVASLVSAQERRGVGIIPPSGLERAEDVGVRMHTNYRIFAPDGVVKPQASPAGETPASLACVYNLVSQVSGCPISGTTAVPSGGKGVIVIVDAYDYPSAASDLATFSTQFGLPAPNFVTVYAGGRKPANGCRSGWQLEESLDIEWAHGMAPNAQIVLMEASSNTNSALYAAVTAANSYIAAHGGVGEVSMSWGGSETSSEASSDHYFTQPGVVYFASSGDSPGVIYPSASVNVVSAGGTQVNRSGGNYVNQTAWADGGGGDSKYEPQPSFQSSISGIVGSHRGTPDLSFDSSGGSPVAVYNSNCYGGWLQVYGTSVAAPSLAGIINSAGRFNPSSSAENTEIYGEIGNASYLTDITSGSCGTHSASTGWDFCTGVGVPSGYSGK
ncbi:MAG TPA: S53 family peptidase [Terriglobales bacterium]|nr:S53 family peptidase [Terriglobales bacterium]